MIVSRFWDGKPMPDRYVEFGRRWMDLNEDTAILTARLSWLYDPDGAEVLRNFPGLRDVLADLYRRDDGRSGIEFFVQVADVIGYMMVWAYGDIYVNCDIEPINPLPDQMPDTAWASYENHVDGRIVNAAIGAPHRHHVFWTRLLDGLADRYFSRPGEEMVMQTGPGYLTDFVNSGVGGPFHVFPVEAFNFTHWSEIEHGGDASAWKSRLPDNVIGLHHWGHRMDGRSNLVETATQ